ncbi:hypothetical protein D3C86_1959230 [compost metagenome]
MDIQFGFDTKTGWQWTNANFSFDKGIFWQGDFVTGRDEFHRTQEAGRVTRCEQLLWVGDFAAHTAHLFWYAQFDVQDAIGRGRTAVTASGSFGFCGINNFF